MFTYYITLLFAVFSCCANGLVHHSSPAVTVVGAGLAGLTAGYRLQQLGFSVHIYEARGRAGGRIWTCYFNENQYEDLGGTNINDARNPKHVFNLVKECNLSVEEYNYPADRIYLDKSGNEQSYLALVKNGPKPTEVAYKNLQLFAQSAPTLHEVLDHFLGANTELRSAIEKHIVDEEGSESAHLDSCCIDIFWRLYVNLYSSSSNPSAVRTGCTVHGGIGKLAQALADTLHDAIHYRMPLVKLDRYGKKYSLTFADDSTVEAEYLILALPCTTLRDICVQEDIFPDDQKKAIRELQYGTNAKILIPTLTCNNQLVPYGQDATSHIYSHNVLWSYFGGPNGVFRRPKEIEKKLEKERHYFSHFFPSLSITKIVNAHDLDEKIITTSSYPVAISWFYDPYAKGSYSNIAPGQHARYNEQLTYCGETVRKVFRPLYNSLVFAGEHTSITNPATIEGAIESGEQAARLIALFASSRNK